VVDEYERVLTVDDFDIIVGKGIIGLDGDTFAESANNVIVCYSNY
jgi:hypothetical protein